MYKAIHLLAATLLLGIHIFNTLLINKACIVGHYGMLQHTLKATLRMDKFIIGFFGMVLLTGSIIVPIYHWEYSTPWISAAYLLLTLVAILWAINASLKSRALKGQHFRRAWFLGFSGVILIALLLIMRDAVTKNTWI